jgi:general secretion pathway protein I
MSRARARFSSVAAKAGHAAGFVLIDALVSLLVTCLVLAVLFEAVSQNLAMTERVADRYQAALFARSKLATLGIADALAEGQSEGQFDPVFSWALTVKRDEALSVGHEAASVTLVSVQLVVRWQRQSKRFQLTYKTRRLIPQKEASVAATIGIASSHVSRPG